MGTETKLIPLTQGMTTLVDAGDYDALMKFKWYAMKDKNGNFTARRNNTLDSGKRVTVLMHRQILNAPADMEVDHENHNTLDNRRRNIRICTPTQNACNRRRRVNNSSGCKGVSWSALHEQWRVRVQIEGKSRDMGLYRNFADAKEAYVKGAKKIHGEFFHGD